jgi:hypothetical protein
MAEITSTTKDFQLGTDGVTYFEVTTVTYDDESQDITKRPVGTAAALTADQADKIEGRVRSLASDTVRASRARTILNEINSDATEVAAATGQDPLKTIQNRYQAELLQNGWLINDGGGDLPIVFTVNAQGNLRYNVNGTGAKGATIYGAVIRLNNYPASPTDTEFFLAENGRRYYSLPNRNVIIKKP